MTFYSALSLLCIVILLFVILSQWRKSHKSNRPLPAMATPPKKITVLPELNQNFSAAALMKDDVFNWGITGQINVGLLPDLGVKYTVIVAMPRPDKKWWQSREEQMVFSGDDLDTVMKEANQGLKTVGYALEYENSKDFKAYRACLQSPAAQ